MCDFISVFVVLRLVLVYLKSKIGFLVPKHIHALTQRNTSVLQIITYKQTLERKK